MPVCLYPFRWLRSPRSGPAELLHRRLSSVGYVWSKQLQQQQQQLWRRQSPHAPAARPQGPKSSQFSCASPKSAKHTGYIGFGRYCTILAVAVHVITVVFVGEWQAAATTAATAAAAAAAATAAALLSK